MGISSGTKIYGGSSNYLVSSIDLPTYPEELIYGVENGSVAIDDHCLIGANSVILPSSKIPEGCAISALSIVSKNINLPEWGLFLRNGKTILRAGKARYLEEIKKL